MQTTFESVRPDPETRALQLETALLAARVLRESAIPPESSQAQRLFPELLSLESEDAMRSHVAASKAGARPLRESSLTPAARKLVAEGSARLAAAGVPTFDSEPLGPKPLSLREASASALAARGIPITDASDQTVHTSAPSALEAAGIPMLSRTEHVRLLESSPGLEKVSLRESVGGGIIRRIEP
jgi:hypothetical protein